MKRIPATLAAAFLALGFAANADAFSYQGALADVSGKAMKGTQTVEFRLYGNETGGTALWGRACNVLLDDNGMFNTEVADASGTALSGVPDAALDSVLAANAGKTLFLGLTVVGSSGEIAPRLRLLPVPYAVYAHNVARATGDFAAAGKVSSSQLAVSGDASFSASATVSGDATVEGDLTVSGAVSGYGTVPVGTILLWSGAANKIPDGWALCDGSTVNGSTTPDLRGRFVVGYHPGDGDYNAPGKTGGETRHTLSKDEMPEHNHSYSFKGADLDGGWDGDNYFYDASGHYSGNNNTKWTNNEGSGKSHENRPPYYTLCYIMRVK